MFKMLRLTLFYLINKFNIFKNFMFKNQFNIILLLRTFIKKLPINRYNQVSLNKVSYLNFNS